MRPWVPLVVAAAASAVAQAFGRFTYPLLLTTIQEDFGVSYTVAGGLASVNLVAYLVGTAAVTWLASKWVPGAILRFGLVISTVGLIGLALSPGPIPLGIGLLVTGFAGALIWVPAPAVGASLLPPRLRGLGFGSMGAGIGLGVVAAGLLAIPLRAQPDPSAWRILYAVEAAVAVVVVVVAFVVLRRPTGAALAVTGVRMSAIRTVPRWVAILVAYAAFGLSYSWFINFLVAMLEDDRGVTATSASVVFLIVGAATIPGGVIIGRISDAVGRRPTMMVGFAAMAAGALGARYAPPWLLYPCVVLFGLAFSGVPTTIAAYLGDHTEPGEFPAAFGVATLAFGIAQMLAPQVGGIVGDVTGGFTAVFIASAAAAGVGALAASRLELVNRGRTRPGPAPG
ncbi:MAG: MFS transporter [Acidimicrobiia bacterium]